MKIVTMISIVFVMIEMPLGASFFTSWSYGNAAASAQKGEWQKAQHAINDLVCAMPDRADIVYDSGVAAYRLSEFEHAKAYFESVTAMQNVDFDLKKQAYFNLGNTHVARKKFSDAIVPYEKVLELDPDNRLAQHNLEKVKEILKQQERDKRNNNDQNNKKSEKNDQKSSSGNSQTNKNNTEESSDNQKESNDENGQDDNSMSASQDKKQKGASDQQNRQKKDRANNNANNNDGEKNQDERGDGHATSSEQKKEPLTDTKKSDTPSQDTKNDAKEQEKLAEARDQNEDRVHKQMQKKVEKKLASHDKWMLRLLDRQQKIEGMVQKEIIKAHVDKQLAGHHEKNCW